LDLVENWAAFMTGGTIAALVLVIERLRRPLPVRIPGRGGALGWLACRLSVWTLDQFECGNVSVLRPRL
jgi:hypothetical protein